MSATQARVTADVRLRLLVFDERLSFGDGLRTLVEGDPGFAPVECIRNSAMLESAVRARRPDVVLMVLPRERNCAPEVISKLRRSPESPAVVVLVDSPRSSTAIEAVQAGAGSVVTMTESPEALIDAIRAAGRGISRVPAELLRAVLPACAEADDPTRSYLDRLTRREREVLDLLASGCDRRAIATRLYCSPETVRTHIRSVLSKLEVHSTVEAVALAARSGAGRG